MVDTSEPLKKRRIDYRNFVLAIKIKPPESVTDDFVVSDPLGVIGIGQVPFYDLIDLLLKEAAPVCRICPKHRDLG